MPAVNRTGRQMIAYQGMCWGAEQPPEPLEPRAADRDRAEGRLLRHYDPGPDGDHDGGVPQGEEEPEPQRARGSGALPLAQHLTRAVIDRRDVIGVKRVPQAERVGQHRHPHPEPLVMRGHHEHEQDDEPGHVQARDHPVHRDQPGPLPGGHRRERLPYQLPDVRRPGCARRGAAGGNVIR
jgi:hypothetical protein